MTGGVLSMKKTAVLFVVFITAVLLFTACRETEQPPADNPAAESAANNSETQMNLNAPEGKIVVEPISGVYVPAIELPENTGGAEMDMIGLFVYKGQIYKQTSSYNNGDARYIIENLAGEKIGFATGSIDEWSTQDDYAVEFAGSVWGDVYEVKGYNDFLNFRYCMFGSYEQAGHTVEWVNFYENLSGFYLEYGVDLFGFQRLNLAGNWNKVMYKNRDDWYYGRDIYYELPDVTANDIDAFIDELYSGRFVDGSEVYDTDDFYGQMNVLLYFYMNDHTVVELVLVEGGYVGYRCMLGSANSYFVQISEEAFDKIYNACVRE
jgi:hypothetical protein